MRLDDLRKEMPETPDFIHKMIQEEVEHQMQETSDWRKPVVITSHLWTMMIIGVIQMRCVIS